MNTGHGPIPSRSCRLSWAGVQRGASRGARHRHAPPPTDRPHSVTAPHRPPPPFPGPADPPHRTHGGVGGGRPPGRLGSSRVGRDHRWRHPRPAPSSPPPRRIAAAVTGALRMGRQQRRPGGQWRRGRRSGHRGDRAGADQPTGGPDVRLGVGGRRIHRRAHQLGSGLRLGVGLPGRTGRRHHGRVNGSHAGRHAGDRHRGGGRRCPCTGPHLRRPGLRLGGRPLRSAGHRHHRAHRRAHPGRRPRRDDLHRHLGRWRPQPGRQLHRPGLLLGGQHLRTDRRRHHHQS